ncbi:MAG: cAMP-binding proteins - catabolite gene activator and regulatory subunit of cAMP-dependent protein kinases, partial [uncultured Sphingomonadaceae bacterium]
CWRCAGRASPPRCTCWKATASSGPSAATSPSATGPHWKSSPATPTASPNGSTGALSDRLGRSTHPA